jgi:hypothetical protein
MKKLFLYTALFLSILISCDKNDNDADLNTLNITEGDFSGYSHVFTPNLGFWSPVDASVKYVHLVLGDDDNMAVAAENVMSIVFYYTGNPQVKFPSAEGQWANFGINSNGTLYYFGAEDATLSIIHFDDTKFEGTLSGEFVNMGDNSLKINFSMRISLVMQEI